MEPSNTQGEAEFTLLHARYRAAWRQFSEQVECWRTLQTEAPNYALRIRETEAAVQIAERQYRLARNAFAEYLLEHSSREAFLVGSR